MFKHKKTEPEKPQPEKPVTALGALRIASQIASTIRTV